MGDWCHSERHQDHVWLLPCDQLRLKPLFGIFLKGLCPPLCVSYAVTNLCLLSANFFFLETTKKGSQFLNK